MAIQSWQNGFFTESPYNDTWDPKKNYISLGFAPGYALQSKELLELQSTILNQMSTTARSMFKHGQPRIDLEEESLITVASGSAKTYPVSVNQSLHTFTFTRNSQFFTNFSLNSNNDNLPNGFWVDFPPKHPNADGTKWEETLSSEPTGFVGFMVKLQTIDSTTDVTLLDTAGGFSNLNAPGATRYAYSVVDQADEGNTPSYLVTNVSRRPPGPNNAGEFFIPIAKYINSTYLWAFDESSSIPA